MSKVPDIITCDSEEGLEYDLIDVREGLAVRETEDTWEKLLSSIQRLNALIKGGACEYPDVLLHALKDLSQPINQCITTERSRLSGVAIECLANLAEGLNKQFEPLVSVFFPTLLSLTTRSSKVFASRARGCILTIVENTQLPSLLPHFRRAVSDKSKSLRLTATDATLACLKCFNPPDLETNARAEDIETIIRATARDADADVRKSSRQVFDAYRMVLPGRVDAFVGPLTPVIKKYLDVKSNVNPIHPKVAPSSRTGRAGDALSASTASTSSAPNIRKDRKGEQDPAQSQSMASKRLPLASATGPSRVQAQEPDPARNVKTGPIRPPAELKNAQVAFRPERGTTSAPGRAARIHAVAPAAVHLAPKPQSHSGPIRPALSSSGGGVQRPPRSRPIERVANQPTTSIVKDSKPDRVEPHQPSSRPQSRTDNLTTSMEGAKPARPVSIRERLMGGARRVQQQLPPLPQDPVPAPPKGRDQRQKPQRVEKKVNDGFACMPFGPALSNGRATNPNPCLSKSTDCANKDDDKLANLCDADLLSSTIAKSARPDPTIPEHVNSSNGKLVNAVVPSVPVAQSCSTLDGNKPVKIRGLSAPTKSQLAKARVKAIKTSPRKAKRIASNRGIQPLAIRKTTKTRSAAKPSSAPPVASAKAPSPETTEGIQGVPRPRSASPDAAPGNDATVCDPTELPLPPSPEPSLSNGRKMVNVMQSDRDDGRETMVPPPTPPTLHIARLPPMTPITKLTEQIRRGFDFTVCPDETLPYPAADISQATSENELACIDFIMDGIDTGGGVISSPRKRMAADRRVLCESNS